MKRVDVKDVILPLFESWKIFDDSAAAADIIIDGISGNGEEFIPLNPTFQTIIQNPSGGSVYISSALLKGTQEILVVCTPWNGTGEIGQILSPGVRLPLK